MQNIEQLCQVLKSEDVAFQEYEPLKDHCTFKIGGPARVFCTPQTIQQLAAVRQLCKEMQIPLYMLGKGSNILFADEGYPGVVVCINEAFAEIKIEDTRLTAYAGAPLGRVCAQAAQAGLAGLEFAFGIPGNLGGAIYMNAGAYGGEIKTHLQSVTFLDENNVLQTAEVQSLAMGYRTSVFQSKDYCIVSAQFELPRDELPEIFARMRTHAQARADKQPLNMPSAGSTFKRPEGAFAGALIEQCGLRGFQIGGAQISEKHCGFVVNAGGATCADVLALTDYVCEKVQKETGFILEKEIRVVR